MAQTIQSDGIELARFIEERAEPAILTVMRGSADETPVLVLPKSAEIKSLKPFLDQYLTAPERPRGTATLHSPHALCAHINRAKDADSAVFVDAISSPPHIVAVYDYHRADRSPRFGEHRAVYQFPLSDEWAAWTSRAGREMTQDAFARFLEERLVDVLDPSEAGEKAQRVTRATGRAFANAAELLTLAQGLEITVKRGVKNAVRLSSGEAQVTYSEQHTDAAGEKVKVPGAFLIGVPVFRDGLVYQIPVRLNYRVSDGSIAWSTQIHDPQRYVDHAVRETAAHVAQETGLPVFFGSQEA